MLRYSIRPSHDYGPTHHSHHYDYHYRTDNHHDDYYYDHHRGSNHHDSRSAGKTRGVGLRRRS